MPSNIFSAQKNEVEMMKKLSKSLLKSWADKRRKELIEHEKVLDSLDSKLQIHKVHKSNFNFSEFMQKVKLSKTKS